MVPNRPGRPFLAPLPGTAMPVDIEQILAAVCLMHAAIFDLAGQDFRLTGIFGIAYFRIGISVFCLVLYLVGRAARKKTVAAIPTDRSAGC